jgi:beta-lactamase regulating signal transducer with metallopeptidase domain
MSLLVLVVKVSVVMLAALGATAMLGRSPAVTRHRLWSFAFALLLAVPALALVMPALNLPVPALATRASTLERLPASGGPWGSFSKNSQSVATPTATPQDIKTELALPQSAAGASKVNALDLGSSLIAIWAVGVFAALSGLALSLFRVGRLSKRGDELIDAGWHRASGEISARLGLKPAPRLVVSERVSSPMAGGVVQPTVFLPINAREWDVERRDVVLTHEIAHLASRDPLRHLVVRVAVACYWFHPLAWVAAHRATVSREQACDEAVLAAGTRPSAYARVLLELAESLGPGAAPLTALPMAQRSNLEKRVMTILNSDQRSSSTRLWPVAVLGLSIVTLSVAAARPVAAIVTTINVNTAAKAQEPAPVVDSQPAMPGNFLFEGYQGALPSVGKTDACRWDRDQRSFSGTSWSTNEGVTLRIGRTDSQAIVQRSFDGLRVCMVADGMSDRVDRPAQMLDRASKVSMSSERDGRTQQLDIVREGGSARTTWRVDGQELAVDAAAEEWRRSMLALLDTTWEVSQIRGHVSSLQGEISSIHGERSSLQGEISSIQGHVSSINGEISSVRGHESTLRGEISSIQGHLSSSQGQVSSEQGAISSLHARLYDAGADERRRIDGQVESHRRRIKEIEKAIADYNADAKAREVMKEIESYNADQRVRELRKKEDVYDAQRRIEEVRKNIDVLKVDEKVREIRKQIDALNADERVKQLGTQQDEQLKRLRAAIAAIR